MSHTATLGGSSEPQATAPADAPSRSPFWPWLLGIAAVALALRVTVVLALRNRMVSGDGLGYHIQAANNASGHWFVNPLNPALKDALHPPAWSLVLTVLDAVGLKQWVSQQLFAALLGTVTVVLVGLIGRRLAGNRAGWLAAGIAALWPGFWLWERSMLSETLTLLLVAAIILVTYRVRDEPTLGRAAGLGALMGLLVLTRSDEIAAVAAISIAILIGLARRGSVGWQHIAAVLVTIGVVFAAVLAPWTIYNEGRFHHRVLISNGLGNVIGGSYCPGSFYGPLTGSYVAGCVFLRVSVVKGDQSDQDIALRKDAEDYAKQHLGRLPIVMLAREGRAFSLYSTFQQNAREADFQNAPVMFLHLDSFGLWLLAIPAIAGVFVLRRRKVPVYPLLTFIAVVVLAAGITDGQARYRAAANVPIALLAAVAIDAALSRWWRPAEAA